MINIMSFLRNYLKKKTVFPFGNFNINLFNYDIHSPTNGVSRLSSHYFLGHILQPRRVKSKSKRLKDNFFSNMGLPNLSLTIQQFSAVFFN